MTDSDTRTDPIETIEVPVADGTAEAYLARPSTGSGDQHPGDQHPGVLFFMDAIGLRPQIATMIQRIADWGYVVLAPNVFHRDGRAADVAPQADLTRPGEREKFFAEAMPRVGHLTSALAEDDIPRYLSALRGLEGVSGDAVGTTGYCMGARLAIRAANLDPQVVAVGGFHGGGLATDEPDSPHRGLGAARAEFVFGHADGDRSMPPEAVAELGRTLAEHDLTASNEVYPGAVHGYSMADTSMYDEAAAERHFTELEALFSRTLGPHARG